MMKWRRKEDAEDVEEVMIMISSIVLGLSGSLNIWLGFRNGRLLFHGWSLIFWHVYINMNVFYVVQTMLLSKVVQYSDHNAQHNTIQKGETTRKVQAIKLYKVSENVYVSKLPLSDWAEFLRAQG